MPKWNEAWAGAVEGQLRSWDQVIHPATHRLIGNDDPTLGQQVLDIAKLKVNRESQMARWMITGGKRYPL